MNKSSRRYHDSISVANGKLLVNNRERDIKDIHTFRILLNTESVDLCTSAQAGVNGWINYYPTEIDRIFRTPQSTRSGLVTIVELAWWETCL